MPTKRYVKIVKSETFTAAIMYHNNLWEIKYKIPTPIFTLSVYVEVYNNNMLCILLDYVREYV